VSVLVLGVPDLVLLVLGASVLVFTVSDVLLVVLVLAIDVWL
jgi:hypothetical protein